MAFTEITDFSDLANMQSMAQHYGFQSHGVQADKIYFSENFELYKNEEDFYSFQERNSNFIGIYDSEEYGITIDVKFFDQIKRYLYNSDRLLVVGDKVFKLFENGILEGNFEEIETIKSIQDDYFTYEFNSNFIFRPSVVVESSQNINQIEPRDVQHFCSSGPVEDRVTNGRDRTYLRVRLDHAEFEQLGLYRHVWKADYMARPYKRTLGIWYWAERTLSACFNFAVAELDGTWNREYCDACYEPLLRWSISGELCPGEYYCPSSFSCRHDVHFDGYDCWADTPSTNPNAELKCNDHLF